MSALEQMTIAVEPVHEGETRPCVRCGQPVTWLRPPRARQLRAHEATAGQRRGDPDAPPGPHDCPADPGGRAE